ncbi:hypothetical protein [Peribacillus frigoritolerans]|uniref:hypothetical protein n=1 Tax=Peribacillus frigoritolerans TaxID=450367 RepID=UPI0010592B68|nr:hypothetical protein [Peribacillus frigoritolerans]TDL82443.1 hypothetical protein E2R53_02380 [Peribacillus frigoritolerans]
MNLFHYHWWTDKAEEMENFYGELGFKVTLRVGRYQDKFEAFNPPLQWNDFRHKDIKFRIIEMVKGQTNITFGNGSRDIFDHFGFIVDSAEYDQIINRANNQGWKVNEDVRRTFISTPWKVKVEVQKRREVVQEENHTRMNQMEIHLPFSINNPSLFGTLLGQKIIRKNSELVILGSNDWTVKFVDSTETRLHSVSFHSNRFSNTADPVNTILIENNAN